MKFEGDITGIAVEFGLVLDAAKSLKYILETQPLSDLLRSRLEKMLGARQWEYDQLEMIIHDFLLQQPIELILEEEQCILKPLRK